MLIGLPDTSLPLPSNTSWPTGAAVASSELKTFQVLPAPFSKYIAIGVGMPWLS
ncbi:hypothetical protein D3C86_1906270 [compost metagenome]